MALEGSYITDALVPCLSHATASLLDNGGGGVQVHDIQGDVLGPSLLQSCCEMPSLCHSPFLSYSPSIKAQGNGFTNTGLKPMKMWAKISLSSTVVCQGFPHSLYWFSKSFPWSIGSSIAKLQGSVGSTIICFLLRQINYSHVIHQDLWGSKEVTTCLKSESSKWWIEFQTRTIYMILKLKFFLIHWAAFNLNLFFYFITFYQYV